MSERLSDVLRPIEQILTEFSYFFILLLVLAPSANFLWKNIRSDKRFSVAIFGLPRSGKTTLVSTLFYRMMRERVAGRVDVSGDGTVRRITNFIEQIRRGINLGPTTDRDVYSFRFKYRRSFFRRYDVEVADFPGEYSEDYASRSLSLLSLERVEDELAKFSSLQSADDEELRQAVVTLVEQRRESRSEGRKVEENLDTMVRLYDGEYNSVLASADRYVVVVDLENVINRPDAVPLIEAKIFSSVIALSESSLKRGKRLSSKDVALVFTKSDLIANKTIFDKLFRNDQEGDQTISFNSMRSTEFDKEFFFSSAADIELMFAETKAVLNANFARVGVFFHSSYLRTEPFLNSEVELLKFMLP